MLTEIQEVLSKSTLIQQKVGKKLKAYVYPDLNNFEGVHIIIDPISPPIPSDYADNKVIAKEYFYQIEVWSKNFEDREIVAAEVETILTNELSFGQYGSGLDERDEDTGIFRDARRYIGKKYLL